jgi:hypothetical protein
MSKARRSALCKQSGQCSLKFTYQTFGELFHFTPPAGRERIVEVPVRTRSARAGNDPPPPAPQAAPNHFTLELPGTPFHPHGQTLFGSNGNIASVECATQLKVPATITRPTIPGSTEGAQKQTPGIPASTPMAAEILANLCGLAGVGSFIAPGAAHLDALPPNLRPAAHGTGAAVAHPLAALAAAGTVGMPQRRAAAVRAAQVTAVLMPQRPKARVAAEAGPRQGCNCKKSQCLKLYCECFAGGGFCVAGCTCQNCSNTEADYELVDVARSAILAKDPAAFQRKVKEGAGHRKGCKCKRSRCLKKYCECYNGGVACNPEVCQCRSCLNGPADDAALRTNEPEGKEAAVDSSKDAIQVAPRRRAEENTALAAPTATKAIVFDQRRPEAVLPAFEFAVKPQGAAAFQEVQGEDGHAAVGALSTPGTQRGSLPFSPPAAPHASESLLGLDNETADTASSPAVRGPGDRSGAFGKPKRRNIVTMTSGANGTRSQADMPSSVAVSAGGDDASQRGKRPRRAASGGVMGAVAAEVATWGLEDISPPMRRSNSGSTVPTMDGGQGTAAAARRERNALLRKALHNETVAGNGRNGKDGDELEADAISALVSLNSQG